jgi:transposase-like protein
MTSLVSIYKRFPTKEAATAHLEKVRWPHGPECPLCGSTSTARHAEKSQADRLQCWDCKKSFSATVGTIFHNSHIDLQRWFLLITLMLNAKKGLSAMQAARDLEMRRPTVWSMMHRIRAAMVDDGRLLSGLVEMDEAYIGGKPRKRNRRDDDTPGPRGRATSKTAVVGANRELLGHREACLRRTVPSRQPQISAVVPERAFLSLQSAPWAYRVGRCAMPSGQALKCTIPFL